jgi:hypothetical protein
MRFVIKYDMEQVLFRIPLFNPQKNMLSAFKTLFEH